MFNRFLLRRNDKQKNMNFAKFHYQEVHHCKITFLDEYRSFLEKFEIEYDERYIFKVPE